MTSYIFPLLILLIPVFLYTLAVIAVQFYREKCPHCHQRKLMQVQFIKATIIIEGKRAPDSWGYYVCQNCGTRHKKHQGLWESPTEAEWNNNVGA